MKKIEVLLVSTLLIGSVYLINYTKPSLQNNQSVIEQLEEEVKNPFPNDKWMQQRSYPNGFNKTLFVKRMDELKTTRYNNSQSKTVDLTLPWLLEGPGNIGGRFNVLKQHPTNPNIIFAGAANGGVFKTTDGGATWNPIFDDLAYMAVGDIEIDASNPNIMYVGTGDKNFGGGSHIGNGVYKTTDGGTTWTASGLDQTGVVTKVIVDPTNSNTVFAATLGNTYEKTNERGVYKSTDGGSTWNNVLFISDSSGVIDMIMDPNNPNTIYATGYNRLNTFLSHRVYGPAAKIFKTTDGGTTWTTLGGGLPTGTESRIGLSFDPNNSNTVFAIYVGINLDIKDIYKSTDAGTNWSAMNIHAAGVPTDMMGNFGWYFGRVFVNPYNSNNIIIGGVDMFQTTDGGLSWSQNVPDWWTYDVHADKHDVLFLDATSYIIATDGGLYKTTNLGSTWNDIENMPITQFYHIDVDPYGFGKYGGGAQDNGTSEGNATSINGWQKLYGGDGFRLTYLENAIGEKIYETQNGNIVWEDASGSQNDVSPIVTGSDRTDWDTPYFINEETGELFAGTSKMQVMNNAPLGSYTDISGDLTKVGLGQPNGQDRYHTIVEISGVNGSNDTIFAGTNDGLVWRGERNGTTWNWINITGNLPNRYVTEIKSSPNPNGSIYVCFSGYTNNDYTSYIFKSDDYGDTWIDISGNLPNIPVNDIEIPQGQNDDYLFAALDGGVYFTKDGGVNWDYVGVNIPLVTISDLEIDYDNQKLIAGTFSRSMYSYDISWIDNLGVDFTGIGDNNKLELSFYPNPVVSQITINTPQKGTFKLFNINGEIVLQKNIINQNTTIDVSNLSKGIYFYQLNNNKGKLVKG
jgi:photosystem II stability/assembly factor-like uncharacterized protein